MEERVKISNLIKDYQILIRKLDDKLAVYEQLGSPESIAEQLGIELKTQDRTNEDLEVTVIKDRSRAGQINESNADDVAEEETEDDPADEPNTRAGRLVNYLNK